MSGRQFPADARRAPLADRPELRPWYREPAPWLLMAGPAAVILAGAVTVWLAISRPDNLVSDDYYKRGLLVERRLERDAAATRMALGATLSWDAAGGVLDVAMSRSPESRQLPKLLLRHAARAKLDRDVALTEAGDGRYQGVLRDLPAGRWDVILETEAWRLEGKWLWPQQSELRLGGQ